MLLLTGGLSTGVIVAIVIVVVVVGVVAIILMIFCIQGGRYKRVTTCVYFIFFFY